MDLVVFLPLLIILGAFMFFASRRQKKAMQATIDLHELAEGRRPRAHHVGPAGQHQGDHRRQRRPGDRARRRHHLDEARRAGPHRADDDESTTTIDDADEPESTATEITDRATRTA